MAFLTSSGKKKDYFFSSSMSGSRFSLSCAHTRAHMHAGDAINSDETQVRYAKICSNAPAC